MASCNVPVRETVSQTWLYLLARVRGRKPEDEMRRATLLLNNSIQSTASIERTLSRELQEMAVRVRGLRARNAKTDLHAVLLSSRNKRIKLVQTTKKRIALEHHLETLNSTLLNQQVMSSVKQSSDVLKAMGLEQELQKLDDVSMDLQESFADAQAVQSGLAESMGSAYDDDMDLEAEMLLLLDEAGPSVSVQPRPASVAVATAPAATTNSMRVAVTETVPEADAEQAVVVAT